jgi:putative AlgH/UPF0301 family transcriptional regulator
MLVSAAYLVLVVFFTGFTFPHPEGTFHTQELYNKLRPESKQKIATGSIGPVDVPKGFVLDDPDKWEGEAPFIRIQMPNGHILTISKDVPKREAEAVAAEYWSIVEAAARRQQFRYAFLAFLWFVIPVAGLYGLGWSIGWVYRGFKGQ